MEKLEHKDLIVGEVYRFNISTYSDYIAQVKEVGEKTTHSTAYWSTSDASIMAVSDGDFNRFSYNVYSATKKEINNFWQAVENRGLKLERKFNDLPSDRVVKLAKFPIEGWCDDAKSELGHFLADRCNSDLKEPGNAGYAWSRSSYWTIFATSGKPRYKYKDLTHFISEKFGSSFDEDEEDKVDVEKTERFEKLLDKEEVIASSFPRPPDPDKMRDKYFIGDEVMVTSIKHSTQVQSMKNHIGALGTVRHDNGLTIELEDKFNYSNKDIELIKRGKEGEAYDKGLKETESILTDVGTTGSISLSNISSDSGSGSDVSYVAQHSFNTGDAVKLIYTENLKIKHLVGQIGWVVDSNNMLNIGFYDASGSDIKEVRYFCKFEDLRYASGPVTNSPEDLRIQRRKYSKNFGVGEHVIVTRDIMGYDYTRGCIGLIIGVYPGPHCDIEFYNRYPQGRIYKVHKDDIEVTKKTINKLGSAFHKHQIQRQRSPQGLRSATREGIFMHQGNLGVFDPSRHIGGIDPYVHALTDRKAKKNIFDFDLKEGKKNIKEPVIKNRVVKSQHIPDKNDKFVKDNPELIIELESVKDRTIKVKK